MMYDPFDDIMHMAAAKLGEALDRSIAHGLFVDAEMQKLRVTAEQRAQRRWGVDHT